MEAGGNGQFHDSDSHSLLWTEGPLHECVLVDDVLGQLGNNMHECASAHAKGLQPLFVIPGGKDYLFPLLHAAGM